MVLRRDPICKACRRSPSTCVDHIRSKAAGGTDELHNLQGLCDACHAAKTSQEALQGRRFARG